MEIEKESTDDNNKDKFLTSLKKSAFAGLIASVAITFIMLIFLSRSNWKRVGIVMFVVTIIIFLLKNILDIAIQKIGWNRTLLANGLFALFALLIFLGTTIRAFAPAMLFMSVHDRKAERALKKYSNEVVEPLKIETRNGTVTGWLLHNAPDKSPVVLYFGGNGEDAAYRMSRLMENSEELTAMEGCNIACLDYPSYGNSEGTASEKSFQQYGLAVYDYLTGRNDVSGVIVMGYSIGTGVANYVASQRQPLGLILIAPYADGYDLYNSYLNIFHGPLKLLVSFKMKSVKYAEKVTIKPLILASNADETVPYKSSQKLFEKYKKGCNFITIDGIGHDTFWDSKEVLMEISKYIASVNVTDRKKKY